MAKRIVKLSAVQIPDETPDTSYLEQAEFADRLAEYQAGNFGFLGVQAQAEIVVSDVIQTITSGGLWGIESDSDESYLRGVAVEELVSLKDILREMGFSDAEIDAAPFTA